MGVKSYPYGLNIERLSPPLLNRYRVMHNTLLCWVFYIYNCNSTGYSYGSKTMSMICTSTAKDSWYTVMQKSDMEIVSLCHQNSKLLQFLPSSLNFCTNRIKFLLLSYKIIKMKIIHSDLGLETVTKKWTSQKLS